MLNKNIYVGQFQKMTFLNKVPCKHIQNIELIKDVFFAFK